MAVNINIKYGVSYLTQVTVTNHNRKAESQAIKVARVKASAAREKAALANARADVANARAGEAKAETVELAKQFEEFKKQMFVMWQSGQVGPSSAPSSIYPNSHHDYESDEPSADQYDMSDC